MSNVELTNKQYNEIKRAIKSLNDVRKEIQTDNPDYDISWYVENGGSVHLMSGDSHSHISLGDYETITNSNYDNIIDTFTLLRSECGGW